MPCLSHIQLWLLEASTNNTHLVRGWVTFKGKIMAATVTSQTILDGTKTLIVKIHIDGDAAGDLTDYVLVDASTFTPAYTNCSLRLLHALLSGFTAHLLWDATTNVEIINVPDYEVHYSQDEIMGRIGSLPNNAGAGKTGDILITTSGLAAGDHGTMVLEITKKY